MIEVEPDNTDARIYLGRTLVLAWRDEEGVAELERANAMKPDAVDIERKLKKWRAVRYAADRPD